MAKNDALTQQISKMQHYIEKLEGILAQKGSNSRDNEEFCVVDGT